MKKERVVKKLIDELLDKTYGAWDLGEFIDLDEIVDGVKGLVHEDGKKNYGCDLFHCNYEPITNVYGHGTTPCGAVMNALDQLVGLDVLERELI
jgi:hypothetical protein